MDAWETLAEYYYGIQQFDKAFSSLQTALSHLQQSADSIKDKSDASMISTKKVLLRKLSMVQRRVGTSTLFK